MNGTSAVLEAQTAGSGIRRTRAVARFEDQGLDQGLDVDVDTPSP